MAALHKLSARQIASISKAGLHGDGGGLFLQVTPAGSRSWVFRTKLAGRVKTIGLGPYPATGLAAAREKAAECRTIRASGLDPLAEKRRTEASRRAAGVTFRQAAEQYIDAHAPEWRSPKTLYIWRHTLKAYAYPIFGSLPVADVDRSHVEAALTPIWLTKAETSRRLRRQIEAVIEYATAKNYRSGENPALLRGGLRHLLPKRPKADLAVKHHAALPFAELPAFMGRLNDCGDASALALRVLILTACRTGEVLKAKWGEVDFEARTWTIPAERMKGGRAHRVPLSAPAIAAFKAAAQLQRDGEDWIFPGGRRERPLSDMALLMLLRRLGRSDVTAHGFRSSFRDWAAETTHYQNHVVEMALAHSIGNAVEAAYRRGDLFEKRRALMADWGKFCSGARPEIERQTATESRG